MAHRYAVYLTPDPEHLLWSAGCAWLGRDPFSAATEVSGPPAGRRQPWRYGFHATLKAPMRLAPGLREDDWLEALQAFAAERQPFDCPPLQVSRLGATLALRPREPVQPAHPLWDLARACVTDLDVWRAPLCEAELMHRRAKTVLDDEQMDLLALWGYPHVLHRWHWHFTLSDQARDFAELARWHEAADSHFAEALTEPLRATALSVFVEDAPGRPLRAIQRFGLGDASCLSGPPLEVQKGRPEHQCDPGATVLV